MRILRNTVLAVGLLCASAANTGTVLASTGSSEVPEAASIAGDLRRSERPLFPDQYYYERFCSEIWPNQWNPNDICGRTACMLVLFCWDPTTLKGPSALSYCEQLEALYRRACPPAAPNGDPVFASEM